MFRMVDNMRADPDYAARVLDPNSQGHNQMATWLYNNPGAAFEDYYKVGNPGYEQLKQSYLSDYAETEWQRRVETMEPEEKADETAERIRREAEYDWYADEEIDDAGEEDIVIPATPDIPPETYMPDTTPKVVIEPTPPPVTVIPTIDDDGDKLITTPVAPMPTVTTKAADGFDLTTAAMIVGGILILKAVLK